MTCLKLIADSKWYAMINRDLGDVPPQRVAGTAVDPDVGMRVVFAESGGDLVENPHCCTGGSRA
jgi:hypothetical protein